MSKADGALSAIVSLEVECFITELERIRSVHSETLVCLDQVDYEHHFDKDLYRSSAWGPEEEAAFTASLSLIPKLLLLGTNPLAKAAVVNEILASPALPTLLPEESAEAADGLPWSPLVIRYASCPRYSVRKREGAEALSVPIASPSPSPSPKSSLPLSAVRHSGDRDSAAEVALHISHSLLKDGAEILLPAYGAADPNEAAKEMEEIHRLCRDSFPLIIFVISTPVLTDLDIRNLRALKEKCRVAHPIFFVKSRPYVRSDLPESERYGHAGTSAHSSGFVSVSSIDESDDLRSPPH